MKRFCIIISGPTGVGKSELAESLAQECGGEIINCDVGQFYTPLSIGTAKPQWKHSIIPHHLFDIIDTPRHFSVIEYREMVEKKIEDIWARNKIPFIVGGSGFYIRSIFYSSDNYFRLTLNEDTKYELLSTTLLWEKLFKIDPLRANKIHKNDRYRIIRALNLWDELGKLPSECKPLYRPLAPCITFYITREREELYKRINERVTRMLTQGWQEEVFHLSMIWKDFIMQKKIIGYNELIDPSYDSTTLKNLIAQRTRHYAKRQITFWKALKKDLLNEKSRYNQYHEVSLTFSCLDLYINEMHTKINEFATTLEK
jgi:tRNA dimethylallyltransferase